MQPWVNHVLAGTAHVLRDRRAELALEQLYVDAQRAADEARGSGEIGDFGFGCSPLDVLRDVAGPVDVLALDGWPDLAPPSRALRVLELMQPRLRPGALVLNDGGEPDYLGYVRGPGSTLRTSLLDLGVVSVSL